MMPVQTFERKTRKFLEFPEFLDTAKDYYLLPFRFHRLNETEEIIVNDTGEFLIIPAGTTQRIVEKKIHPVLDEELYADLLSRFFISEQPVPDLIDILATKYRTKKSFLDNFTSLHIFVISLRCDHSCHYCQVSRVSENREAFDMKRTHLDKGIDLMMQSPSKHLTMEFQGGEALLAFENIKYGVEKAGLLAAEHNKQITYVICSNLAPLTDEMLEYCKEKNILVSTSLDGPAFIHNQNRYRPGRNSYELAIDGIRRSRETLGEDRVSALMTTTALSLKHPVEIVEEYFNQGFKSIFLRPISPYGFATKSTTKNHYELDEFLTFFKTGLRRIIDYNLQGNFYREDYSTIILKKILTPFPVGYVDLQSPAGMINSVIVFNYDGNIYATDESRMLAETGDYSFKLGSLDTHSHAEIFYGSTSRELSKAWCNESLPGCSECAFQSFCGADPVMNYTTQGDIYGHRPTSFFCAKNMAIIRHLFELMKDPAIKKIFYNWVSGV